MVCVELVYIPAPSQTRCFVVRLHSGATVADALHASGIYQEYPETQDLAVGIYAKQVSRDTVLKDGDRIELYRPLTVDPKESRRQRARKIDR